MPFKVMSKVVWIPRDPVGATQPLTQYFCSSGWKSETKQEEPCSCQSDPFFSAARASFQNKWQPWAGIYFTPLMTAGGQGVIMDLKQESNQGKAVDVLLMTISRVKWHVYPLERLHVAVHINIALLCWLGSVLSCWVSNLSCEQPCYLNLILVQSKTVTDQKLPMSRHFFLALAPWTEWLCRTS